MPGPKRAAKIEAKRKKREAGDDSHAEDPVESVEPEVEEVTSDEEEVQDDGLDDKTKDELKEIAEALGLPTYGTKAEIVERIRE